MFCNNLYKLIQIDDPLLNDNHSDNDGDNIEEKIENKVKELLDCKYQLIEQNESLNENNLELENKIEQITNQQIQQ